MAKLPAQSLVVLDPADGPGDSVDPKYVEAVTRVTGRGIQIFGYVTTDYGRRPSEQMTDEILRYQRWYQPSGIFLDQTPPSATDSKAIMETVAYLRSEALALVLNPGQPDIDPEDAFVADHVVNFEGPLPMYFSTRFPSWIHRMSPSRFWHLVYEVGNLRSMRRVTALAARRHAGIVYVTDGTMPNPWERLPAYWDGELAHLVD